MLEWLKHLHSVQGISEIIGTGGLVALVAIVFAETGLLVGFFFPGDSLLITAGVLSNPLNPNHVDALHIGILNILLVLAAIVGNQTGFFLGRQTGSRIWNKPDGRLFKRKHLEAAQGFYNQYGGISVLAARYVPIMRTFVPFVAGVARMPYRNFVFWDIAGGTLWITSLLWAGYFLGQTPLANRLDRIIVLVIFVSTLPLLAGAMRRIIKARAAAQS